MTTKENWKEEVMERLFQISGLKHCSHNPIVVCESCEKKLSCALDRAFAAGEKSHFCKATPFEDTILTATRAAAYELAIEAVSGLKEYVITTPDKECHRIHVAITLEDTRATLQALLDKETPNV